MHCPLASLLPFQATLNLDGVQPGYSLISRPGGRDLFFKGFLRTKDEGGMGQVMQTFSEFKFSDLDSATVGAREVEVESLESIKQVRQWTC